MSSQTAKSMGVLTRCTTNISHAIRSFVEDCFTLSLEGSVSIIGTVNELSTCQVTQVEIYEVHIYFHAFFFS